jgi:hypothetical protein
LTELKSLRIRGEWELKYYSYAHTQQTSTYRTLGNLTTLGLVDMSTITMHAYLSPLPPQCRIDTLFLSSSEREAAGVLSLSSTTFGNLSNAFDTVSSKLTSAIGLKFLMLGHVIAKWDSGVNLSHLTKLYLVSLGKYERDWHQMVQETISHSPNLQELICFTGTWSPHDFAHFPSELTPLVTEAVLMRGYT